MSSSDFARSAGRPASAKSASEAMSGAVANTEGLLTAQDAAPRAAVNCGSMRKRVDSSCPHQPASRAPGSAPLWLLRGCASAWRWCTKQPPMAPGPAFRYL